MLFALRLQKLITFDMELAKEIKTKELNYYLKNENQYQIKAFGLRDGFLDDNTRVQIYEFLFTNPGSNDSKEFGEDINKKILKQTKVKYENVIEADIKRSFNTNQLIVKKSSKEKEVHRKGLKRLLLKFFSKHRNLCYFQGFNSVASTLLLFFGEDISLTLLEGLSEYMLFKYLNNNSFEVEIKSKLQRIKELVKETTCLNLPEL